MQNIYSSLYIPEDIYAIRGQIKIKKGEHAGYCLDLANEHEMDTVAVLKKCDKSLRTQGYKKIVIFIFFKNRNIFQFLLGQDMEKFDGEN